MASSVSPHPGALLLEIFAKDVAYLGKVLRVEREAQGKTLEEVAMLTGLKKSHIANIETGKGDPRLKGILRLACVLGIAHGDLLPPEDPSIYARLLLGIRIRGLTFAERLEAILDILPDCHLKPPK